MQATLQVRQLHKDDESAYRDKICRLTEYGSTNNISKTERDDRQLQ